MSAKNPNKLNGHELIVTRSFNAPRALVWQAWTAPKRVVQWWGPKGFSNSSREAELRVGGAFRLTMCGPDGDAYPCTGIYREIKEPERIAYDSEAGYSASWGEALERLAQHIN